VSETSVPSGGVQLGKREAKAYWLQTDLLTFKAIGKDTSGALAVLAVDLTTPPGRAPCYDPAG
jgi:hypothetical protein